MAVDSSNQKHNSKKTSTNKNSTSLTMPKTENKSINEIETISKEKTSLITGISNLKWLIILVSWFLIIFTNYLMFPKLILNGSKEITINYNEKYSELGYKAYILSHDISNNIITNNNVKNGTLGTYYVNYSLKYGLITIRKIRIVHIIDNIPPVIEGLEDEITICPNDQVEDIEYKVTDEYDGDITESAINNYLDNKMIITAKDKSNNQIIKEITIKKEDTQKPTITLKGNTTMYLTYGTSYLEPGYTASDNCDGDITDRVEVTGSVSTSIGTYKLTYSVTDNSGNKETVTRTITIRNNNLYNSGTIGNGTIYLTFDDGPNNGTTNVILDILKETGVKATFFVTCNGPDSLIKRMYDEGHTVALHTASHNYSYIYSSIDNYFADLNKVSDRVKNITDIDSKIIRFPGGSSNTVSRNYSYGIMTTLTNMVLEKGYRYFDWNVDAMDASSARSSSDVYNNVTRNLSKNRSNVVLMHDIKAITRDALRNIIKYGQSQGYTFSRIENDTYMIRHGVNN